MTEQQSNVLAAMSKELETIQSYLEVQTSDELAELTERIAVINVYLARTGKSLADAKYIQDEIARETFDALRTLVGDSLFSAKTTIVNKFISAMSPEPNRIVTWSERLNRECVHHLDSLRTLISLSKETMRLENSPYGQR